MRRQKWIDSQHPAPHLILKIYIYINIDFSFISPSFTEGNVIFYLRVLKKTYVSIKITIITPNFILFIFVHNYQT